jgi:hypothetical protein
MKSVCFSIVYERVINRMAPGIKIRFLSVEMGNKFRIPLFSLFLIKSLKMANVVKTKGSSHLLGIFNCGSTPIEAQFVLF